MSPNQQFLRYQAKNEYTHVSALIVRNPARAIEIAKKGHSLLPELIVGPRTTYFQGQNERKRILRSMPWRSGTKAHRLALPTVRCTKQVTK